MSLVLRRKLAWLCVALTATVPACGPDGEATAPPAGPSTTTQAGPARLTLTADRPSIRTVDRLTVALHAVGDPGVLLAPPTFDPTEAGWTVVSRVDEPLRADAHGRTVLRSTMIVEPFLEGDYTLPPATLAYTDRHGAEGTLLSEPLTITVHPVLTPEDSPTLAAPAPMLPAPGEPGDSNRGAIPWLIAAAAAVAALAIAIPLLRRRPPNPPQSPQDRLRELASRPEVDPEAAYAAITRALAGEHQPNPAARALADEADRVRFGRASASPARAAAAAREVLALLSQGGAA